MVMQEVPMHGIYGYRLGIDAGPNQTGRKCRDDTTEDDSIANQRIRPATIMMRNDYKRSTLACMEIDRREGKRRERIEGIWNNKNKRGN